MLQRLDQDVEFWLERARHLGGWALELACGTGRLTGPLARAGIPIVGLDNDPVMLAAAKRHPPTTSQQHPSAPAERPRLPLYLAGDMRQFALARRFRLIFVGYNSLQLLTAPANIVACLEQARQHLAPGGQVGIEATDFQSGGADGPDDDARLLLADVDGIRLSGTLAHDLASRTSRYRRHFEGEGWAVDNDVVVRSLDRAELEALFQQAGLDPVAWWAEGATVRALASAAYP